MVTPFAKKIEFSSHKTLVISSNVVVNAQGNKLDGAIEHVYVGCTCQSKPNLMPHIGNICQYTRGFLGVKSGTLINNGHCDGYGDAIA